MKTTRALTHPEAARHVGAYVPNRLADALYALARLRGRSVSAELRLALGKHLAAAGLFEEKHDD